MSVELTRLVPCATCGGTKKVDQLRVSRTKPLHIAQIPCSKCRGTDGTARVEVSCASCKHHSYYGVCDKTGYPTDDDFGCVLWTSKEGTDGNG